MPLSDTAVRQAKPKDKDYSITDASGLALFVSKHGTKSWHFRYSFGGKQKRLVFGTYPDISLKDARALRDQARSQIALGDEPKKITANVLEEPAPESNVLTFGEMAEQWYAFKAPRLTVGRRGAASQCRSYLDKDILPALAHIPLREVRRRDLVALLQSIEARGAMNVAEKVRSWLSQIFRHALVLEECDANPADGLDAIAAEAPPVKHHPFLSEEEMPAFLKALYGPNRLGPITSAGLKLVLLTGVRNQELRFSHPDHFDLETGIWTIPPSNVKQLKSLVKRNGEDVPPYIVPLSTQAIEIVRYLKPMAQGYIRLLPGRDSPNTPVSENTLNMALKRLGYGDRLTCHGMRATLSTYLNHKGYNSDWIEAQLSHSGKDRIRGAYNHAEYVEQRREMMQAWADQLDAWRLS